MEYIQLGNTDLEVSRIGLGMMTYGDPSWRDWVLSEDDSIPIIKCAVESGINFFDTADVYSMGKSEEVTGRVLKKLLSRHETVLATKVYFFMNQNANEGELTRKHIFRAIEGSLKRLGTDYIDLFQIHRFDYSTPIEETMDALNEVVRSGKARYIGASSMFTYQFVEMQYVARMNNWASFVTMQNHYNLIYREEEREMIHYCAREKIGIIPWGSLARGFLSGNRFSGGGGETTRAKTDHLASKLYYQPNDFAILQRVVDLANIRGKKPSQIALAWLLNKGNIASPIVGASKLWQMNEIIDSLNITLSSEEIEFLEELYQPHEVREHY